MPRVDDDFCPVTGGVDLPKSRFRDDMDQFRDVTVGSDLDRHIVQLLALHPKSARPFPKAGSRCIGHADQEALLADMNDLLGVRPLRKSAR